MNLTAFLRTYEQKTFSISQDSSINIVVANAIRFIIENVFGSLSAHYVVMVSTHIPEIEHWICQILDQVFLIGTSMTVQMMLINTRRQKKLQVNGRMYCNLITVDSYKALIDTDFASINSQFDGLEYYLIFLQARDNIIQREMNLILQYCLDNYWLHCNVMVQTAKGEVLMYTYFPYTREHCYKAQPQLIDKFDGVTFPNAPLFPNKLSNLHNCPLIAHTWPQPPYVEVKNLENGTIGFSGKDMHMLRALSEDMNFSLDIRNIDVNVNNYVVLGNGRTIGPLRGVRDREANMSLSYFRRSTARDRIATCTATTYYVNLVAVVIRSEHSLAYFKMFLFPYDTKVWISLCFCLLLMIVINHIGRRANISSIKNLQIFEILLGVTTLYRPNGKRRKVQFLIWLWCTFLLRSFYLSMVFYLYTLEFHRQPPSSLDALVKEGFSLICNNNSLQFLENIPEVVNKKVSIIVLDTLTEMEQLNYLDEHSNDRFAAVVGNDIAHYFAAEKNPKHSLQILPFNINTVQATIYMPKHSFFVDAFDDNILWFVATGLPKAWYTFSGDTRYNLPPKLETGSSWNSNMSIMHIVAVWIINAFIYATALGVFVLEVMSKQIICLQKLFK